MNDSIALLDTNILVYAHDSLSPYHVTAKRLVKGALQENIQTAITLQNIAEFFAIITDTKRSSKALPFALAYQIINEYIQTQTIKKIIENELTSKFLLHLIKRYKPKRQGIHDVRLVALMLSSDVRTIYTGDKGFRKFKEVRVINPFK